MNHNLPGRISLQGSLPFLRLTCIFWLAAKIISYKAWVTTRLFPVVHVFDSLESIPPLVHTVLYVVSLLALLTLIFRPTVKWLYMVIILSELASVLLDYMRWQPWEYQYLFVLFIFATGKEDRNIINKLAILIAALYFYSGLQKLNAGFLLQVWDRMLLMSFLKVPHSIRVNDWLYYSGYGIGILETLAGIGLLFNRTSKFSAGMLMVMHCFNLVWLGPLGLWYNEIVWPWNVLMIAYLFMLYFRGEDVKPAFQPWALQRHFIIIIFWWILPALNFFGMWDNYLSCSLYSGKLPLMAVCMDKHTAEKQFADYTNAADKYGFCPDKSLIKLQSWAMSELKVPPYPEVRVYRKIQNLLKKRYPESQSYLYYYNKPSTATL